ncbi:hypothetical protein A2U01_0012928, partial [Trifolium medium]|nr:hypothetical protein [Trifolium medium]
LRESVDDIPSDPISDPISDPKLLPIPPGKSSFGAGAHLKTAVGNWSRWLTDLFGMGDDDSLNDKDNDYIDNNDGNASFKAFHLLNALSDLLKRWTRSKLEIKAGDESSTAFDSCAVLIL